MINRLKKLGIISVSVIVGLYILFLLSPAFVSPILNAKSEMVNEFVSKSTGFDAKIKGITFVTSWNFSAGIKAKEISISIPKEKKPFLYAENTGIKLSLIPILLRKVQLDCLFSDGVYADIVLKKDGSPMILDYLPKTESSSPETFELPAGLKLSNNLPSIFVKEYKIAIIEGVTGKSYAMEGEDFKVTNFVLDKRVKFSTKGKLVFEETPISEFNIKVDNRIMPNLQLHDLVFPQDVIVEDSDKKGTPAQNSEIQVFNIIDILKSINKNQLAFNLTTDIKTSGKIKSPHINGNIKLDGLTVAVDGEKLPGSYLEMKFKGHKTDIDSSFYTSGDKNELTKLKGEVNSGKKSSVDLTFKSNAKFKNIVKLVNSIASSFNINDFKTLSATGEIDSDFNIKSDFKKVISNGYLKILPASISYGLYNVKIDNITADINLDNNDINIKNTGFTILGQPLNLSGSILADTTADLKLVANKLSLKGLLTACGQLTLLKENNINGGIVSVNALLKGKLKEIKPEINASVDGVDIYNKPSQAKLTLNNALAKILYDGKSASGNIDINALGLNYSGSIVSVPKASVDINQKDINIKNSYLMLNNSRVDVTGAIKDYISDKMSINLKAKGNVQSSDIAAFLPKDFRNLITYAGKMPISIGITGNSKVQNIKADLTADPNNYISLIDIDSLKGQTTKIHSDIEIIGDSLTLSNTGISNNKTTIATAAGGITKLYSAPKLNLNINVPNKISFPIWGIANSNITANGTVDINGDIANPNMRGNVNIADISIKDMDFSISDMIVELSGAILNGSATAKIFKFGGIIATDISGKFSLKDYSKFYLTDTTAKSFDGNVSGKLSYDIPTTKIGVEFTGKGLNSTKAVEGAVGIKKALTGTMGFSGKLSMQGVTDTEIIKSMKGNLNFNINDGRFVSIGRLENLVAAQNVTSNSILKSAISALSSFTTVQEADKFKSIDGEMTFSNGTATLSKILVSGPSMSYYVKGTYNILQNTANLIILGRLESKVVAVLGPLGQLSAEKLLSYIPKIGAATSTLLNQLTSDPANEKTSLIPALSEGSTSYKDFKVIFNGSVESASSVKSFKWLSTCDTTQMNLKLDLQNAQQAVKENITNRVEETKTKVENVQKNVTNVIETQKKQVEQTKQDIAQTKADIQNAKENAKQSVDNLKNLFQNAVKNSQTKVPATTTETIPPQAE